MALVLGQVSCRLYMINSLNLPSNSRRQVLDYPPRTDEEAKTENCETMCQEGAPTWVWAQVWLPWESLLSTTPGLRGQETFGF